MLMTRVETAMPTTSGKFLCLTKGYKLFKYEILNYKIGDKHFKKRELWGVDEIRNVVAWKKLPELNDIDLY